ncbi:MAG: phage tail assembly chaperone [Candidatus Phlomobacter fragariae]
MESVLPIMVLSVSQMSDEDCNAILYPCLLVVSRQNNKSWTVII